MNSARLLTFAVTSILLGSSLLLTRSLHAADKDDALTLYIGDYTGPKAKGIYQLKFDPATGSMTEPVLAAESESPSFLTVSPNRQFLFSVNEAGKDGMVSAFSVDAASGKLTLINSRPSGGQSPCYLSCDAKGKNLLVANYSSGTVEVLPIDEAGKLGEPSQLIQHKPAMPTSDKADEKRKAPEARAHWIATDPSGKFVIACDLGLDQVLVYDWDPVHGKLSPHDPPAATVTAGTGPRHLIFNKDATFAYVVGELDGTVTVFAWDPALGTLSQIQRIAGLPEGYKGRQNSAEIMLRPDGKFLYTSNRGPDDLAVFAVDEKSGKLTLQAHVACGGKEPRNFTIDPTGTFLLVACQNTNEIVEFKIDPQTGDLKPTGTKVTAQAPVCLTFYPTGK